LKNKRIAVIGTGASGIQVIQECSKECSELTSYQRTPNMCLPMCQEDLPADMDLKRKTDGVYDQAFSGCLDTFAGGSSFASSKPFSSVLLLFWYYGVRTASRKKADTRIQFRFRQENDI